MHNTSGSSAHTRNLIRIINARVSQSLFRTQLREIYAGHNSGLRRVDNCTSPKARPSHGSDASNKCSRSQQTRYQIKNGAKNVFRMGREFNFPGRKKRGHEYLMVHLVSFGVDTVCSRCRAACRHHASARLNPGPVFGGIKKPLENPINRRSFAGGSRLLFFPRAYEGFRLWKLMAWNKGSTWSICTQQLAWIKRAGRNSHKRWEYRVPF